MCRPVYRYLVLGGLHASQRCCAFLQAAAAAADSRKASAGGGDIGALSWTAALYTTAVLHAGPAAAAFAIGAAFQHDACPPAAHGDAAAIGQVTADNMARRLLGNSQSGVVAAAACVLATAAWRHARSAAAGPPVDLSAGSAGGKGSGGAGSERWRSAASGGLLGRAVTAALGYRAALGGCGWRRLKAALLTAVVRYN